MQSLLRMLTLAYISCFFFKNINKSPSVWFNNLWHLCHQSSNDELKTQKTSNNAGKVKLNDDAVALSSMSTAVHHPGNRCIVSRMSQITQRTSAVLFTTFPSVSRQLMFRLTILVRCLRCAVPVLPALSRTRRKGHLYPGIVKSGGETVRPTIITGLVVISWHEREAFQPSRSDGRNTLSHDAPRW